jgi:hypothetical protein
LRPGPSPDAYHVKFTDEIWKIKNTRETIGRRVALSGSKDQLPGPSDYSKPGLISRASNRSCTFYKSTRDLNEFLNEKGRDSPGPKYEVRHTLLSKMAKSRTAFIRDDVGKRPLLIQKKKVLLERKGHFDTSLLEKELVTTKETLRTEHKKQFTAQSTVRCTFAQRQKEKSPSVSPGPGDYAYFS